MAEAGVRGRFIWHELMTTDIEAAAAFYGRVVGWKTETSPHSPAYKLFVAKEEPMAGLMELPAEAKAMGAPPSWMAYIGTPDVDATVRDAVMLGGSVCKEATDIPTIGRFACLKDPQGATFAVFTPIGGDGEDEAPALGDFSWHELITTDWPAAFAFYQQLFGWEKTEAMDMGPMGVYQMYGRNGKTLGGMFNKPAEMPAPPHWLPYALVPDARVAAELVKIAGGRVMNGPMEVPGGDWIVQFMDRQGVVFAVHSRAPAIAKPAAPKPAAEKAPAKKPAAKKAPAKKPAKKPAAKKPTVKKPAKKAAKKIVKKAAKKVAKKAKKKVAKKVVRKAAKKRVAKKAKKKVVKKAVRKTAKKRAARKAPARKKTRKRR